MSSVSPATDVLTRRTRAVHDRDAAAFADLFAADAVIEMAFSGSPGAPLRIEGRDAILAYARQVMASPLRLDRLDVVELHHTLDPDVVVVEMLTEGSVTTTGREFTARSVQILRIRDGRILLFRDFADPRVLDTVLEPGRDAELEGEGSGGPVSPCG